MDSHLPRALVFWLRASSHLLASLNLSPTSPHHHQRQCNSATPTTTLEGSFRKSNPPRPSTDLDSSHSAEVGQTCPSRLVHFDGYRYVCLSFQNTFACQHYHLSLTCVLVARTWQTIDCLSPRKAFETLLRLVVMFTSMRASSLCTSNPRM